MLAAHFAALADAARGAYGDSLLDLPASYNIAPTESIVVVLQEGQPAVRQMK
jgi:putative SOS response-associated peptidase YedK